VHFLRIRTIVIIHIRRYTFTKIRLEGIDTDFYEFLQPFFVPMTRFWICKVNDSLTRLPKIPLPNFAMFIFDEIAFLFTLLKGRRFLSDIRVDPYADLQALLMDFFNQLLRIWKQLAIPFKTAPLEFFHPKTIKMKDIKRNLSCLHFFNKSHDCFFTIVRRKGS